MTSISTKEAARRFFRVLNDAQTRPVVIARHRRPRAVVISIGRFRLYEKLIAHLSEEETIASLEDAVEMARQGRLGLANRALKDAAFLSGAPEPARPKRAKKVRFDAGAGGGLEHLETDEASALRGADKEE